MPTVTVTKLGTSKKGKPVVFFDGRLDWRDQYLLGNTIAPPVGARIEADTASKPLDGGGVIWFLNGWKLSSEQPTPTPASQQQPASNSAPSASAAPQTQEFTFTEPELRFVSNVVGQAIYGGQIKEPAQIEAWFNAAKALILGEPMPAVHVKVDTRKANEQTTRILDAIKIGNDKTLIEVWQECTHLVTSPEFEAAVWAQLPVPVRNRIKDILDEPSF